MKNVLNCDKLCQNGKKSIFKEIRKKRDQNNETSAKIMKFLMIRNN